MLGGINKELSMTRFNEQILVFAGDDKTVEKKKKKGGSLSAVTGLMQSLATLQEEIEDVKDSIDDVAVIEKLKTFDGHIDAMYDELMEITKDAVRSIRKRDGIEDGAEGVEGGEMAPPAPSNPTPAKPSLVTSPILPTAPR